MRRIHRELAMDEQKKIDKKIREKDQLARMTRENDALLVGIITSPHPPHPPRYICHHIFYLIQSIYVLLRCMTQLHPISNNNIDTNVTLR